MEEGASALLECPDITFDAGEAVGQQRLHVGNCPVVVVRGDFAANQLEDFQYLERAQLQLEALLQEALEHLRGGLLLGGLQLQRPQRALAAAHQRPSQATKFCSSCRPWVWLFSGWNCTAKREPSAS